MALKVFLNQLGQDVIDFIEYHSGGGSGGGYSGGNSSDGIGGYGGTSYINPDRITETFRGYATVADDADRNLTNP